MAEVLHPNTLTASGFSSTTASDVGSNDGTTTDAGANNDWLNCAFPSTGGNTLVTGAASQSFTIVAAKTSGSGTNDATYSVDLYQNGSLVANLGTKVLTSGTNSTDTFNWDGSSYTGPANGADVEVRITQTDGASGAPSKRAYVAVDEVYWTADSYVAISPAGINLRTVSGIDFSGATLDATHDAESGDLTGVTVETGTPTASSAQAYEGTYSYLCEGDPTTRDEFSVTLPLTDVGGGNWMGVDFWAYWNNGIPSTSGWLWVEDGLAADNWYLRAEGSSGATGQFQLSDSTGVQQDFDVNLSSAAWYNFKILWKAGNTAEWYLEIRNSSDTLLYEFSDLSLDTLAGTNYANKMRFMGAGGTNTDVYQDLIKVYDGGTYNNSVPFGTPTVAAASGASTLSANSGSFTHTGQAANLNRALQLEASSANFTHTGQAADLDLGRQLDASSAGFTFSGQTANLNITRHLEVTTASFVFGAAAQETGIFDSSDAAIVDSLDNWLNDANAFDGDTGTFAEVMASSGSLYGEGTNLADLGSPISLVEFRGYGGTAAETSVLNFRAYHNGGGAIKGTVSRSGAAGTDWTTWGTITAPGAGWTWADVQALELSISLGGLGLSYTSAHAVELRITHLVDQADLDYNRVFQAASASFAHTGQPADFNLGKVAPLETGTFTQTGQNANLLNQLVFQAETGAFTASGSADLDYNRVFTAESASFTLTGQNAAFLNTTVFNAEAATYTLSGITTDLLHMADLGAQTGAFTLSGVATTLTYTQLNSYTLDAATGAFTQTGQAADLLRGLVLGASLGSFTHTGVNTNLDYNQLVSYTLGAATGAFTQTGQAADLLRGLVLGASLGSFTYTGQAADLDRTLVLGASLGAFTYSGAAADLLRGVNLGVTPGAYTLTGVGVSLDFLSNVPAQSKHTHTIIADGNAHVIPEHSHVHTVVAGEHTHTISTGGRTHVVVQQGKIHTMTGE